MSDAALAVRDLTVSVGAQVVLRGISLDVAAGAIVCILGANGVGKTTLMRAISGIYRGIRGSVRFGADDIANWPTHEIVRAGLAQAPEGRHVFASMSVRDNLRVGAAADPRADAERVFALFPVLRERRRQRAGSLSGGEQQMLCIGRALMTRPRLLLLDEPSLGLAPLVVRQLFDLIGRIRRDGVSILLVEQNARAALRIADYAYVLEGGRIAREGTAAAIAGDAAIVNAYLGGGGT